MIVLIQKSDKRHFVFASILSGRIIKKSQRLLENFQNRSEEYISINSLVGNLFEEVLLIRSAEPPRVLNSITFFQLLHSAFKWQFKQ